jgi:plasmid stabilization system protein ParE
MAYRVELTARAGHDLRRIYGRIDAEDSAQARAWFNGLEKAVLSLNDHPSRCSPTPENAELRHLLYGEKPDTYRVIFKIDESSGSVSVLHIRHGKRRPFTR